MTVTDHVVYQILNTAGDVIYIGSGTTARPEISRRYSHIPELKELRHQTRVEVLFSGLTKQASLDKEARLLRKFCPRLNTLIPRLNRNRNGVIQGRIRLTSLTRFHQHMVDVAETGRMTRRFATTDLDEEVSEFFVLERDGVEYFFEFKSSGSLWLEAWYVPDVFRLPGPSVEFPFRLLKLFLDEVSGKWPGKGMVTRAIEDRTIYWRRLDFTTYTLPFSTDSRKQSCLEMLAFMATAKTVWGFDPKCPGMSKEMGLQKFAGAKVDVYKAQSGDVDVYGTVAFTKMCHDRPAFRLSIYDKKKEVESCGDKNNQKVIAGGEIDLRLRLELQLMPEAFRRLPSLRVGAADREDFAQTSFLHDAFSSEFDQLVCGLLIESMRLLKLDWILLPRDPDLLLNRVAQMQEDPESSVEDGDGDVAMVVIAWKDNRGPLPGSDRVTEKDHPLFGKMSRARASRAYAAVQHACGLDVVKMGYDEITFLWNLLLEAHIPYEERIRLEEAKRRLAAGTMSKEVFSALSQRLYSSARRLAVDSRKDYRQVLGQGQIRQNLRDV